jgi:ferredoxin-NADP reductase
MQVFFEQKEELAPGVWQYNFHPEKKIDFVPGQYVDLHLLEAKNDPRGAARTFSLTSLPNDTSFSFITKHFGLQTPYKQALFGMHDGDGAHIDDAMGDLILPKSINTPLVFVAGGIGIASYASIFKYLLAGREERSIFLFYYLRSRRERIFRELTDAYPLELQDVAIAPNEIRAEHILSSVPPDAIIYISGSHHFVEELQIELEALGTPRSQIIFDYFDGYVEL